MTCSAYRHFLGDVADVRYHQCLPLVGLDLEVSIKVGDCTRLCSLHLDGSTNERFVVSRRHNRSGHSLGTKSTRHSHCLHREHGHDEHNKL